MKSGKSFSHALFLYLLKNADLKNCSAALDIPGGELQDVFAQEVGLGAGADEGAGAALFVRHFVQYREGACLIRCDRRALFDLDGIKNAVFFDDQVDLAFGLVCLSVASDFLLVSAPVIGNAVTIINASVGVGFQDLRDREGLEHGSAHGPVSQGFRREPAGQVRCQPGVAEIDFRRFDGFFQHGWRIGLQQEDDPGSFQNGEPFSDGRGVPADLVGDVSAVEHLSRPGGDRDHEPPEIVEVMYGGEFAHVALQIGFHVAGKKSRPIHVGSLKRRIAALVDDLPDIFRRLGGTAALAHVLHRGDEGFVESAALDLPQGQSGHLDDADAAGKGFRRALHQFQRLRTGQAEQASSVARVARDLDEAEQPGRPLHFVVKCRRRIEHHEHVGIFIGLLFDKGVVDGNVFFIGKQGFEHGGLSRLPRPRHENTFEGVVRGSD